MAEAKSEYLAVNKLKVSNKDVSDLMFGSKQVRLAWMNGKRVWDIWATILSAEDFSIDSRATSITSALLKLKSYGTDILGENHDMNYTIDPTSISSNTSSSSRTKTVTVNQTATGKSVSVTATQAGRVFTGYTYGTPWIDSASASVVGASGNITRYVSVAWSQTRTAHYDNGTTSSDTVSGTSTATVIKGSSNIGAYISNGGVYVPSAGTTYYTSQRTAYTVSQLSFYANNVSSGTVSYAVNINQSANNRSITHYGNYKVSISSNKSTLVAFGDSASLTVSSTKDAYYTYSSGATGYATTYGCNANLSTSSGNLGWNSTIATSMTVSNGAVVAFYPHENASTSARTLYVTAANAESTSVTNSVSITQNAASYEFYFASSTSNLSANGGTVELILYNSRNGAYLSLTTSNIKTSVGTVTDVSLYDDTTSYTKWVVKVSIGKNGTTARNITVTATQPESGKTTTHTITQAASQVVVPSYKANVNAWWDGTTVNWEVSLSASSYEAVSVAIKVQDSSNAYGNVYYTENAELITNVDTHSGYYDVGYNTNLYVVVYYENTIIGYGQVN